MKYIKIYLFTISLISVCFLLEVVKAQTVSVKALVVAGGGGSGAGYGGGGGGGGGVIYNASYSISAGSYSINVGDGGIGSVSWSQSTNGGNSVFNTLTAIGGGCGAGEGSGAVNNGGNGGTGGGASSNQGTGTGGIGTNGQGYAGGNAYHNVNCRDGGGGGGAGAAGANATAGQGGNGGNGVSNSITGSSIYYGGGGGGTYDNRFCSENYGTGGLGGGGDGSHTGDNTGAVAGTDYLGGGGGAGGQTYGANGGKGVVIIAYTTGEYSATGGTITTSAGNTIHTFTSNGTFNIFAIAAPTVTTQAATSIAGTTATGNGNVTADGGATITERGVCWNTSATPTTANSKATSAGTTGAFTSSMTGLNLSTLYYVRAYAINSVGVSYGNEVSFTTLNIPSVTIQAVTNITGTTATANGNVTADGGATISERGICWNTSAIPTTANSKATSTGTTGAFTASMTGLITGTLYYVRAYAINSVGISYGNQVTFSTPAPANVDWNNSNVQEITLSANRSFTFTNGKSGGVYILFIKQNGTGNWSVTWPSNIMWTGGTAPTLTTTANAVDVIKFVYDGNDYYAITTTLNFHH